MIDEEAHREGGGRGEKKGGKDCVALFFAECDRGKKRKPLWKKTRCISAGTRRKKKKKGPLHPTFLFSVREKRGMAKRALELAWKKRNRLNGETVFAYHGEKGGN